MVPGRKNLGFVGITELFQKSRRSFLSQIAKGMKMTTVVAEMNTSGLPESALKDSEVRARVLAIKATWSSKERSERAMIGVQRRSELVELLFGPENDAA